MRPPHSTLLSGAPIQSSVMDSIPRPSVPDHLWRPTDSPTSLKVLLVDDDPDDVMLVRDLVEAGEGNIRCDTVSSFEEGLEVIGEGLHDAYLIDYRLGARDGLELISETVSSASGPMVLLTGMGSESIDRKALSCGAADYLSKNDLTAESVQRSIRYAIQSWRARHAAEEGEARYQSLFEGVPVGIFRLGPDGRIIDVNRTAVELLDYPDKESLLGRPARDLVEDKYRQVFDGPTLKGETVDHIDVEVRLADGGRRWVALTTEVVRDTSGQFSHVECAITDISERKAAEGAKGTFLAGVSHEVRSPLTAMIGFLDLVNQAGDSLSNDERTQMLETVSRQADDVLNLIEDFLASARVEAGTLKVVSVRCNLAAQVRQVVESIQHNARISIELTGDGVFAAADPARVRQIIRNLLTNADRYGGNTAVVEVKQIAGVASIEVRDEGPGVPEADRQKIFEPYGQSEANRRVNGSVGLGLHVSRELARLMGGELSYDYVAGWSVFTLCLPEHHEELPIRV